MKTTYNLSNKAAPESSKEDLIVDDYITTKDFCEKYSSIITLGGLRWILYKSKFNGSDCFVRKLGPRKLLISPSRFFGWLDSNKREGSSRKLKRRPHKRGGGN